MLTYVSTFALLLAIAKAAPILEADAGIIDARKHSSMVPTSKFHRKELRDAEGFTTGGHVCYDSSARGLQDWIKTGAKTNSRKDRGYGYCKESTDDIVKDN